MAAKKALWFSRHLDVIQQVPRHLKLKWELYWQIFDEVLIFYSPCLAWKEKGKHSENTELVFVDVWILIGFISISQQGAGHAGHLRHFIFTLRDKIVQGCFSKMWQLIPINNTCMHRVKVHVSARVWRCECVCVAHKRKVNTLSMLHLLWPLLQPAPTRHIWQQRNFHSVGCCFVGVRPKNKLWPHVNLNFLFLRRGKKKQKITLYLPDATSILIYSTWDEQQRGFC